MIFERTKAGQENRALFHNVDYVCYVEGGGGQTNCSEDVIFWKSVFKAVRPEIRIRFIAKGGKPTIESHAKNIVEEDIKKTIVAMDSDYDGVLGEKIEDYRVFYTYGYSWENDVFYIDFAVSLLQRAALSDGITKESREYFILEHNRVMRDLRWPSRADFAAFRAGTSVLPRETAGRVVKLDNSESQPRIDRKQVLTLCRESKKRKKYRLARSSIKINDIERLCVGHVYFLAVCYLIQSGVRNIYGRRPPSSDHIKDIGISCFAENIQEFSNVIVNHYKHVCQSV